jgi:2-oxoglutarate ferredoxin oxidoreductase subunit beta
MLHTRDLTRSIEEALARKGFSFIEVLAPCPTGYGRRNGQKPIESLKLYQEKAIVKHGANPADVTLDFKQGITLGKFVEYDRPTFSESYDRICRPMAS